MKLRTIGMLAGLALLLPSTGALAHTDVQVDLGFGYAPPPAVVVERPAYYYDDDYYYPPERVYYRDYYGWYPRHRYYYAPRAYAHSHWRGHDRDDRGWHEGRGHRHHDDD